MGCRLMKKKHTESTLKVPEAVSIIISPSKSTQASGQEFSNKNKEIKSNTNQLSQSQAIESQGIHICISNLKMLRMEDEMEQSRPIQNFQSPPMTGHMSFIDYEQKNLYQKEQ